MNFSEEVKAELWAMIDTMSNDTTPFTMNPGKDFSRKKKWDFVSVLTAALWKSPARWRSQVLR